MFIERITERESRLNKIVASLKYGDIPLVLYGGGRLAQDLYHFLAKNSIHVDYVGVDIKYYKLAACVSIGY